MNNTIKLVFTTLGITTAEIIGLCSNGDSAMMGNHKCGRGLLRNDCP